VDQITEHKGIGVAVADDWDVDNEVSTSGRNADTNQRLPFFDQKIHGYEICLVDYPTNPERDNPKPFLLYD